MIRESNDLLEAVFTYSATSVFERLGNAGLFIVMAALFVALLPFLTLLPPAWPRTRAAAHDAQERRGSRRAYPCARMRLARCRASGEALGPCPAVKDRWGFP